MAKTGNSASKARRLQLKKGRVVNVKRKKSVKARKLAKMRCCCCC